MSEEKLLLTVQEAAERLGIGRTLMYEIVLHGRIGTVRIGRCRRISPADLHDFVERLRRADSLDQISDESEPDVSWS